jgi:hypothetical protein
VVTVATAAQLRAEPYWNREIVTAELDHLGNELCRRAGQPRVAFGSKGNTVHLSGAHRSQEWIENSQFCTSRTYTVQPGLTAVQKRHVAGADFTPAEWGTARNRQLMVAQTRRLVTALKAGRLAGVREVIGTLDGRTVVGTRTDGSTFSSDRSHLEHWHLTFDRRRLTDRALMERILAVALGEDDDMTPQDLLNTKIGSPALGTFTVADWLKKGEAARREAVTANAKITALAEAVATLGGPGASHALMDKLEEIDREATERAAVEQQRAVAEEQRDTELRQLVEQHASGELSADAVVQRLAERLAA